MVGSLRSWIRSYVIYYNNIFYLVDNDDEGTVWSVGEITLCYPLASEVSESIYLFALCSIPATFYPFYIVLFF